MEKPKEKDSFQAAKEAEARILKLQAEVHHLKQRIQLSESEERAEKEENLKKLRENKQRIKKLESQLEDLQIRKNRGLKGDERTIAEAFRKHSKELGFLANKSGREAVKILDGKILDLMKKSNALTHQLRMKEKKLLEWKEAVFLQMEDDDDDMVQSESARRIRELENEYMKMEKNFMECKIILSKYKAIQAQLKQELAAYPKMIDELEAEYQAQRADAERLAASEVLARDRRDQARTELAKAEADATKSRLEKERIIGEFGKALKPRITPTEQTSMQSVEIRDTEAAEEWRQMRAKQEAELKSLRAAFEKIKAAIGISDIRVAESRFRTQRQTYEELSELVDRAEKRRQDLKEEAERLKRKNESLMGAEISRPQVVLEAELQEAKLAKEEQLKRRLAGEAERDRILKLLADVKSGLWHQLQMMEKYMTEEEEPEPMPPTVKMNDLVIRMESVLQTLLERLQDHNVEDLKKKMAEEEILKKMDAMKMVPPAVAARKAKPTEEEESSDDEDLEKKRNQLKKEAQIYAEMKKKQQGRGRMMML